MTDTPGHAHEPHRRADRPWQDGGVSERHVFQEAGLGRTPIRELGLTIAGTPLEPILATFERELDDKGISGVRPSFYLSGEWGVPEDSISIAIPFYLARPELTELHAARIGHVEGTTRADILRYLRHEMGHVVNYAYELHDAPDWVRLFGAMTQDYQEDYRPQPFSRRFVRHLPGWYAQKHPDEDWAETFAVWMTPGLDWRGEYADWPEALAKLEYCARVMGELAGRPPTVTDEDLDEDVSEIESSLDDWYREQTAGGSKGIQLPRGLDGALRAVFDDPREASEAAPPSSWREAAALFGELERELMSSVFVWTGHFPERTRDLLAHLRGRAEDLRLAYDPLRQTAVTIAITTLITALAMNYVHRGVYLP
jgi:hypothetical protein